MKPDFYTKAVLTVIAVMLTVIAVKPMLDPDSTVRAQAPQPSFVGVQYSHWTEGNDVYFDSRTGDKWEYVGGDLLSHNRVTKLGQPTTFVCYGIETPAEPHLPHPCTKIKSK
jgi:hypothetical protein